MRKNLVLKDGATMRIEPVNDKDDAKEFQRFINTLIKEGVYLPVDTPVILREENNGYKHRFRHREKENKYT